MPADEVLVHEHGLEPGLERLRSMRGEAVPANQVLDRVEPQMGQFGNGLADGRAVVARRAREPSNFETRPRPLGRRGGDEDSPKVRGST